MTTEEKLERFHELCMEDAREQYRRVIEDYQKGLSAAFEEHKTDVQRRAAMRIQIETEKIARDEKRQLSISQIEIRREISEKQEELKAQLFQEVEQKLDAMRKSPGYIKRLSAQAEEIRKTADGQDYVLYVDAKDAGLCAALGADVKVGDAPILGGIIGIIPAKNLVIDDSFRSKLAEEKRAFRFAPEMETAASVENKA